MRMTTFPPVSTLLFMRFTPGRMAVRTAETPTGIYPGPDGHADEKMTKHYQEGHTEKEIVHLEMGADLAF